MHKKGQPGIIELGAAEDAFPYEMIFNAFPDLIFIISTDGYILNFKAGSYSPFPFTTQDWLHKKIEDVMPAATGILFQNAIEKLIANGKTKTFEFKLHIKDKDYWYEVRLSAAGNERILAIARDITSKKEAEALHEELISILKTVYTNSAQFTGLMKTDGTLLHANKFALEFGGVSEEQVLNKPIWEGYWWQVSAETKNKLKQAIQDAANDVFIKFEAEVQGRNNKKAVFDFSLKPVKNSKGAVIYLIPEGKEITEEKERNIQEDHNSEIYTAGNIPGGGMSVYDNELRFSLAGGPALQALGLSKEKTEGSKLNDLVNNDTYQKLAPYFEAALRGETSQFEMFGQNNRWYLCISAPFYNRQNKIESGFITFSDIQYQKEIEKELKNKAKELYESHSLFKALIAGFPNTCILVFNKSLQYTNAGGAALEENGYLASDLIGRPVSEVLQDNNVPELLDAYQQALEGKTSNITRAYTSTGHYYYTTIAPIFDDENNIMGGIAVAFDVEKQKRTEEQLEQKIRELSLLNDRLSQEIKIKKFIETNLKHQSRELKRKNQELEQFAYVASHDLQEPLRMVSSFTQLLSVRYKNQLDNTAAEFIGFAVEGAQRMQILINDLLTYSRIGTQVKPFKNADVKQVMRNALNNLSVRIEETGATVTLGQVPDTIAGDETQLTQLFQNLISNALKFKKDNISPAVFINAEEQPEYTRFYVQDNGIGLDMEHKERIFQIFQRLHTKDKYPGTGIGLAICKKIVERHEGEIWVESEKEKGGTRFYFTIKKQQA